MALQQRLPRKSAISTVGSAIDLTNKNDYHLH